MYNNLIYKNLGGGRKMRVSKLSIILACIIFLCGCGVKGENRKQGESQTQGKNQKQADNQDQDGSRNQDEILKQEDISKQEVQNSEKSIPYNKEESCLYIWEEQKDSKLLQREIELAENIKQQSFKFEKTDIVLLNERTNYPLVVDRKDTPIKRAIDAYGQEIIDNANAAVKEYVQWAKEEVAIRQGAAGNVEKDSFNPYEYSQDFVVTRNDDKMITFVNDVYTFTGGAHPNRNKKVDSYNPKTGKLVTIGAITSNKEAFYNYVTKSLEDYVIANNCTEYLFQEKEYKEAFKKWDNNWWIRNGYLFVGFNPYDIAPYVAGPLVIPIDVDSAKEFLNAYGRSLFE